MKCPMCNGERYFYESIIYRNDLRDDCYMCNASGKVAFKDWLSYSFWEIAPYWFMEFMSKIRYGGER